MMATDASPKRTRRWLLIVPVVLLVLLAVVWSGVWVYAANRAEHELDAWVGREAKLGRVWNCPDRRLGGFPFRFELTCTTPSLETHGGDAVRFTAMSSRAVAQIWAPNHIVAEFAGPARVEDRVTGEAYAANWSLLQMSGIGDLSGQPQRFSLVVHDPVLEKPTNVGPAQPPVMSARLLEFHVRRLPGNNGPDALDYAAGITGGESAMLKQAGSDGPVDVTLQGIVTAAADLRPMPVAQRLKAWAAAGGVARLEKLTISAPQVAASAKGVLALDRQGRLNGNLDLGFSGLNDLVKQLDRAGVIPSELSPIVGALAMVGRPGPVDGRQGVTFALSFKDGTLRLGGFPVGMVPPAF